MYKGATLLIALATATAAPVAGHAQDWRTITSLRQYNGEEELRVNVQYGAGTLRITPGTETSLYRSTLRYDADRFKPLTRYDAGELELGIDGTKAVKGRNMRPSRLDLTLGTAVPLDLDLKFGAGEADLDLGGLRVREIALSTGASHTSIRATRANPASCKEARFEVGAASFQAHQLGNLNCQEYSLSGGVGEVVLDFTGDLRTNASVNVEMGLGSLTLRVPRGLGLSVRRSGVLTSFDSEGLVKRGNVYESVGYDRSPRKLNIDIDAALGAIRVQWVDK